jgi:hypothetical protein
MPRLAGAFMTVFAAVAPLLPAGAAQAQQHTRFGHEILVPEQEIELALSAAPPAVAQGAAVWVLRADGFAKVREGTNGFNCLVQRANDVDILAPTCFDPEASRTIMAVQLYQGALWAQGKSGSDVNEAVAAGFRSGKLRPPSRGAVGFMLSSGQRLGADIGNWKPHMMIYAPYVTEADIGADLADPKNPLRMLNPGRPDARIVVIVSDFVDPGHASPRP